VNKSLRLFLFVFLTHYYVFRVLSANSVQIQIMSSKTKYLNIFYVFFYKFCFIIFRFCVPKILNLLHLQLLLFLLCQKTTKSEAMKVGNSLNFNVIVFYLKIIQRKTEQNNHATFWTLSYIQYFAVFFYLIIYSDILMKHFI
jgi:hypothetical protein